MIDLNAYCRRIGYSGPRAPSAAVLRSLHALHPAAIPFENLDPFLGRPVPLDLAALEEKLLHRRRGGYCFEQNLLFKAALETLGLTVTGLAARVLWMAPEGTPPNPRAHMLLKVETDEGAFIADVGFGGLLSAAPLALVPDVVQPSASTAFRLTQADGAFTLETGANEAWKAVYRFTLEPQFLIDYEVANWFTSAHPESRFRKNLILQRVTDDARIGLLNRRLTRRKHGAGPEEAILASAGDLAHALAVDFGIEPPNEAKAIFEKLPKER